MDSGYIAITHRCSHRCIACPNNRSDLKRQRDLPYEIIKKTVDEGSKNANLKSLIISGGEPTFHPDFFKIVEYVVNKDIVVSLFTTGESFLKEGFLERLLEIVPISHLRITTTLHSFDPEKHDYMTRFPGSWKRSFEGMNRAISAGIPTALKYIVTQKTYADLPEYAKAYVELFPQYVALIICHVDYCGVTQEEAELIKVPFDKSQPFLEKALDYFCEIQRTDERRTVRVFDLPLCNIKQKYWSFIDLRSKTPLAIFNSPSNEEMNYKINVKNDSAPQFDVCKKCKRLEQCPGTWSSVKDIFGEEIFHPVH